MDSALRVPCSRCGETLLVWVEAERFYVGCPYKGCALTALPREADAAVNLAWHGSSAPAAGEREDGTVPPYPWTWERVARRVGEEFARTGPDGYDKFGPAEWQDWMLSRIYAQPPRPAQDALCPGCGGAGWIPAGDGQLGCIDCNGTGKRPAQDAVREAAERLIRLLYLYPNYRVDSRGAMGLVIDALAVLAPDLAERLREGETPETLLAALDAAKGPK